MGLAGNVACLQAADGKVIAPLEHPQLRNREIFLKGVERPGVIL
jgi:hypothetical protein